MDEKEIAERYNVKEVKYMDEILSIIEIEDK